MTIFTKPKCETCKLASRLLTRAKVPHRMIDITIPENAGHRADLEALGAKGVPVIISGFHTPILGFRPDELKALIEGYKSSSHSGDLTKNERNEDGQ